MATSYVFVLAIVGPVLTRFTGGPRPATMQAVQRPEEKPGNRE